MNNSFRNLLLTCGLITLGLLALLTGCEISSGDEVVRNVPIRVSGTYINADGIPQDQSGAAVTSITLSQSGDQLDGVDNNGRRWNGTLGRVDGSFATFQLEGQTTAGQRVVLTGTISITGTTSMLSGTWLEPAYTVGASAQATVAAAPAPTATPSPALTPTPTPDATPDLTVAPILSLDL